MSANPQADELLYLKRQLQILDGGLLEIGELAVRPGEDYRVAFKKAQAIAEIARREAGTLPQ